LSRSKHQKTVQRPKTPTCPSCSKATPPDAAFCPHCGKPLGGSAAGRPRDPVTLALYSIIGIAVIGSLAGIIYLAISNNAGVAPPPMSAPANSAPPSASSVDLSSMPPREAADRLFNRVMAADEQGNRQVVVQFAPMALQAYDLVENLDADAHYHIGLINAATGDLDNVRKQVEILKQFSPNHLLGLMLEYSLAEQSGDQDAAAKATSAFKAAYALEISAERPEYKAHMNSIEKFLAEAAGR